MTFKRNGRGAFVFEMGQREKKLLLQTIALYPLVPATHHQLSKTAEGNADEENQRLLEQSLLQQRQQNRRQVEAMLEEPQRFREVNRRSQLTLSASEVEWLLQVLNDIRVGSWLALGAPDEGKTAEITDENAQHLVALEVCGLFESALLAALGMEESSDWR